MITTVKINSITPADYNPREISTTQFEQLKKSLIQLGFILPILVNSADRTIIAGHQRTKAATAIGLDEVPAMLVKNLEKGDEIKFNQLHNGCEMDENAEGVVAEKFDIGFSEQNNELFKIGNTVAPVVKELCKIIIRYGNCLCAVCCDGAVIVGHNYIKACQLLGLPVNVSTIEPMKKNCCKKYLYGQYGEYNYNGIKRQTYVQGLAQLHRSTEKEQDKKQNASNLYEKFIIPFLSQNPNMDLLDFGCGKGAYVNKLSKQYKAIGIEFFNNNGTSINVEKGHLMINRLIERLKEKKTFDVVVCDSVLNSVDSLEAENAVVDCLNLFCDKKLFISGRPLDDVSNKLKIKKDRCYAKRFVEFIDKNNFSGNYRKGNWYFQHWHTKDDITRILESSGFKLVKVNWGGNSWQIEADKISNLERERYIKAIDFEFNLPLPKGSYNRHDDIKKVLF